MSAQPKTHSQAELHESAKIIPLRPSHSWQDPLRLMQDEPALRPGRIILWVVSVLVLLLVVLAAFGKLDIIVSAEGRLVPRTLLKVVQPADAGVVRELLVHEGDSVRAGQELVRLDATMAVADRTGISSDFSFQKMQERRIEAELTGKPITTLPGDAPLLFAQVEGEFLANRRAFLDNLEQEKSLLSKAEHERLSGIETQTKLEQTLPSLKAAAESYEVT